VVKRGRTKDDPERSLGELLMQPRQLFFGIGFYCSEIDARVSASA
jgi:hypothetical protein